MLIIIRDVKPILKWAGGKRQLLDKIVPHIESFMNDNSTYFEPFFGGGAVLFFLQPNKAVINDYNPELANLYSIVKDYPEELIAKLSEFENSDAFFYKIRKQDRENSFNRRSNISKAARTIYLNKTCFNGLYRVNSRGEFNVPFGYYKSPTIVDETTIRAVSKYFNSNDIKMMNVDFEDTVLQAKKGDFVYLDPPYIPISKTSSFTAYTKESFDIDDQIRLRDVAKKLKDKGVNFMISNSRTDEIYELYSDEDYFIIDEVSVNRSINSNGKLRKGVKEVLITNTK